MGYGSGGGGAATFLELLDTPESYSGQALKLAKVNAGATGLNLDLLLSFIDWYAGGAPTSFPWVYEADVPFASDIKCSPIIQDGITGQYHVFVIGSSTEFFKYNITTKQYHKLTDAPSIISNHLALSPDGNKLAGGSGSKLSLYDIQANTWTQSPDAPQISATNSEVMCLVWADNDVIWAWARAHVGGTTWTIKCFKYTVSTETWNDYTNSITPSTVWAVACSIKTDGSAVYAASLGSAYNYYEKYTIGSDGYSSGVLGAEMRPIGGCDREAKIWVHKAGDWFRYWDCDADTLTYSGIPDNTLQDKPSNWTGGFRAGSQIIYWARAANPKLMSYFGTGSWRLAQKTLTDYNLVVFRKPADGFAISAVDMANGFYIPIHLFDVLCLPAGTWEFFYPKDGDYTKLKISGSELK